VKGARGWIIAAVVSVLIGGIAYALQPRQDSPEHSTNSDAANGASAVLLYAQAMGHPTDQVTGTFNPPDAHGMMFVFTPTSPYTSDEAQRTLLWVRSGGVLVYASEQGDGELDRALGVTRVNGLVGGALQSATPVVAGVRQVAGGPALMPIDISAGQVALLRADGGLASGYTQQLGSGTVVVLADPLVLCNGYLEKQDNGLLLADLLGIASPAAPVAFDEYHHGLTLNDVSPQAWVTTPWGAGLLWLIVAVFFGLLLRGRRFGPVIERAPEIPRSDVEWAVAVGQLLRRSSARSVTLAMLAGATERAVASYTGLSLQPRDRFWQALWVRAPQVAAELAEVETSITSASATEGDLMRTAERLHRIAHPLSKGKR
jgi:hypothetical protein